MLGVKEEKLVRKEKKREKVLLLADFCPVCEEEA